MHWSGKLVQFSKCNNIKQMPADSFKETGNIQKSFELVLHFDEGKKDWKYFISVGYMKGRWNETEVFSFVSGQVKNRDFQN